MYGTIIETKYLDKFEIVKSDKADFALKDLKSSKIYESESYNNDFFVDSILNKHWKIIYKPKMYTIEDLKTKKIAVLLRNSADAIKLKDIIGYGPTAPSPEAYYRYNEKGTWNWAGFDYYEKQGYTLINFKDIGFEETKTDNMKKIVGYKAPMDLFGGSIKSGTLFIKEINNSYRPKENGIPFNQLPKEIVETWEPVYEEEFKVGDYAVVVSNVTTSDEKGCNSPSFYTIGKVDKIREIQNSGTYKNTRWVYFESGTPAITENQLRKATEQEIKEYNFLPTIEGYTSKVLSKTIQGSKLSIGCKEFTKDDLESYKKLLSITEKKVSLKIGDTEITLELINKLLKALN